MRSLAGVLRHSMPQQVSMGTHTLKSSSFDVGDFGDIILRDNSLLLLPPSAAPTDKKCLGKVVPCIKSSDPPSHTDRGLLRGF